MCAGSLDSWGWGGEQGWGWVKSTNPRSLDSLFFSVVAGWTVLTRDQDEPSKK